MVSTRYSMGFKNPDKEARAYGRELRISRKATRELASAIKNKRLEKAKEILSAVIEKKQAIPFKRYKKKVAHRKELSGWDAGRYPVKSASYLLRLLDEVRNNAIEKGLDADRLFVRHISAYGGRHKRWNRASRVYGRRTVKRQRATNIEIVVEER